MNPFSPGDRVRCKANNRRNGSVVYIYCGSCENCNKKTYNQCAAEQKDKSCVLASFPEPTTGTNKRFRYDYSELEAEPPLPLKPEEKTYDLSPKDIRPLGTATINVPLIVPEDDDSNEELEEEPPLPEKHVQPSGVKPAMGIFFDQYAANAGHKIDRPI